MSKRFNDRISIFSQKAKTYDEWGQSQPIEWEEHQSYWACVKPALSSTPTAIVTLRGPFQFGKTIRVLWQDTWWRITHDPVAINQKNIQFKMEEIV